jgi:hypothetical protein
MEETLPMQQTISGKFIINLLDTLIVSCNICALIVRYFKYIYIYIYLKKIYLFFNICAFEVKILLSLNNPQVTKAFNSRVGTSEAIRLLSIDTKSRGRPAVDLGSNPTSIRDKKWNE